MIYSANTVVDAAASVFAVLGNMKAMNFESAKWRRNSLESGETDEVIVVRRRRNRIIMIVVAALVLIAAAFFMFGMGGSSDKTAVKVAAGGGNDKGAAPGVTVIVPGHQQVARLINATGTLGARRDMPVGIAGEGAGSSASGRAGHVGRRGPDLAVIDRSVQAQESAQLAAQIEVSRADARLAQAGARARQALVSRGFVSKADVERRMAARDAANARVRVAPGQSRAPAAPASDGSTCARRPRSRARPQCRARPDRQRRLGRPLPRRQRRRNGDLLARLPETDLAQLRTGVPASVTRSDRREAIRERSGRSRRSSIPRPARASPESRSPTTATSGPAASRRPRFARARWRSPLLPESAVQSDDKGNFVYIVDQKNEVVRRPVRIGDVSSAGVAIVEGLNGTERVGLSAGAFLNPATRCGRSVTDEVIE